MKARGLAALNEECGEQKEEGPSASGTGGRGRTLGETRFEWIQQVQRQGLDETRRRDHFHQQGMGNHIRGGLDVHAARIDGLR